jgi:tRNA pseudouridine38-40 synthase
LLEYDGAHFMGWQRQAGLPTIQGELERALMVITQETCEALDVRAAGRTDAGVHALGQVVTFITQSTKEPRRFAPALNHYLPTTIRVHRADAPPEGFSARRDSLGKTYSYTIYQAAHASATWQHRAWHVKKRLCVDRVQRAADALLGEHDFESFRSVHCDAAHAIRRLDTLTFVAGPQFGSGQIYTLTLVGNAFCRHMCRIIAGTLIEIGAGMRGQDSIVSTLLAKDRRAAGTTAPGYGLTLMQVHYPPES